MKEILEKNNLLKPLKVGETVEGKIIGHGRSAVYIDLGFYGSGIIFGKEFFNDKEQLKKLAIGDNVVAKVVELENDDGYVELSIGQAGRDRAWESFRKKKTTGDNITVKIIGANKGGLLTKVDSVPAFIPVSQLSQKNYPQTGGGDTGKILKELQEFVGQEMEVRVFDVSKKNEKLILSQRLAETKGEDLKKYNIGDIVEGEITGIVDFGAFIRFGEGLEGLIHISEMDWQIVESPSEKVTVGEKIKVKIIDISEGKIFLSLKAMEDDPWKVLDCKEGDKVTGKVVKINPFGVFVQIEGSKAQGLCHVSEFGSSEKMKDDLVLNKDYDFQITSFDPLEHRMILKPMK